MAQNGRTVPIRVPHALAAGGVTGDTLRIGSRNSGVVR
jgi:hypothetical protein